MPLQRGKKNISRRPIFLLFLVLFRRGMYVQYMYLYGYGLIPQLLSFGKRNKVGENNRNRNLCFVQGVFFIISANGGKEENIFLVGTKNVGGYVERKSWEL
jgi:hypothetical protein